MKVLHVLKSRSFSGAENVVCQIFKLFENEDWIDMAYASPTGPIEDVLKAKGITYLSMGDLTYKEIKRIINEYKPDIIHAHDMSATYITSKFASNKVKVISHIHGTFDALTKITPKSVAYYLAVKKCSHIFFVSQSTYDKFIFKSAFKYKSSLLQNVINKDDLYNKIAMDPKIYKYDLIFLGRLSYPKNPERLIEVIAKVATQIPNLKAAIIGTGELESTVRDLAGKYRLNDNIDFYGFQSNPYKILQSSKIMLITSRSEGTPMCAIEALALGVPIVSTPTDGLKEVVVDGYNGYLSNDDEGLAGHILKILLDYQLQTNLSIQAKKRFSEIINLNYYKMILSQTYKEK